MDLWIVSTMAGALAGGLAVLILGLIMSRIKPIKCPDCRERLSHFRKPANLRQALWGGFTCSRCGCEIDWRGNKIKNS
jgi:hypothetical protein